MYSQLKRPISAGFKSSPLLYSQMHTGRGGKGGEGGMKQHPPRQIFKKLVNKNAIKRKIGVPPWQFFLKPLTPPQEFWQKHPVPPPLDFQPVCIYVLGLHWLCLEFGNVRFCHKVLTTPQGAVFFFIPIQQNQLKDEEVKMLKQIRKFRKS